MKKILLLILLCLISINLIAQETCIDDYKLGDKIISFTFSPLLDTPDLISGKTIAYDTYKNYTFVSKINDKYLSVTDGTKTGFLFVGFIITYTDCLMLNQSSIKQSENIKTSESINDKYIHTGPRGGHYYINSNGNKTYVK